MLIRHNWEIQARPTIGKIPLNGSPEDLVNTQVYIYVYIWYDMIYDMIWYDMIWYDVCVCVCMFVFVFLFIQLYKIVISIVKVIFFIYKLLYINLFI